MKCLLKYQWVKLPRDLIPRGKGIMGSWARMASRAAFRSGKSKYCGHVNEVAAGSWAGGVVGLKSILGVKSRAKALEALDKLSALGYISYTLDTETKKLEYRINDWVVECSGAECMDGAVFTTDGYGFLCLPRDITQRLADQGYTFEDSDAFMDLWCHTVFEDPRNAFSYKAPVVQFGRYGAALTLESLGSRWGWEKTKVWRFLQKHKDAFALHKLPGAFGCLIFNTLYPTGTEFAIPSNEEIKRILNEIRIHGQNTHFVGNDNARINRLINWYSKRLLIVESSAAVKESEEERAADLAPIIRACICHCWNCKKVMNDCWSKFRPTKLLRENTGAIRGPCREYIPRFASEGSSP